MKYKVQIDYKNFIPIEEDELEKALRAFAAEGKAIFKRGATDRITAVLPDFHALMGWNYGYQLQAEDWQMIRDSEECEAAGRLLEDTRRRITGGARPPEVSGQVKQLARTMTEATFDR